MSDDMLGWGSLVVQVITLILQWYGMKSPSRERRRSRVRFRSFRGFGIERVAYDREDDHQS